AIVIAAGSTPGLLWEYSLIREQGHAGKTIFLFPPGAPSSERVQQARGLFTEAFGDILPAADRSYLISKSGDGEKAGFVKVERPSATAYLSALRGFLQQRERDAGRPVGDGRIDAPPAAILLAGVALGIAATLFALVMLEGS